MAGRLVSIERENGLRSRYQYDAGGRLVDLRHHAGPATFAQFHYEYDEQGRLAEALEYVPFAGDPGETVTAAEATPVKGTWNLVGDFRKSTGAGDLLRVAHIGGMMANLTLGTGPDHGLCGIYIEDGRSLLCIDTVDTRASEAGEVEVTITLRAEGCKFVFLKNEKHRKTLAGSGSVVRFKQMTSLSFADAPAVVYSYDALGRLHQAEYPQTNPFQNVIYERDLAGNVTRRVISAPTPQDTYFAYDAANRLTSAGSQAVSYDDNGNMESDGSMTYTWDRANRLIQVQQGANSYQHAYNGLGQRLKLTRNSLETRFLYDGQSQQVLRAEDVATQTAARFVLGPMGLLGQLTDGPWLSPLLDGQGSVRAMVSENVQAEIRRYWPHGSLLSHKGDPQTSYGFGGGYEDPSGLSYLFTDFYQPAIGQGIQVRPGGGYKPVNAFGLFENSVNIMLDPNKNLLERVGAGWLGVTYFQNWFWGHVALAVGGSILALSGNPLGGAAAGFGFSDFQYAVAEAGLARPVEQQRALSTDWATYVGIPTGFGALGVSAFSGLGQLSPIAAGSLGLGLSTYSGYRTWQDAQANGWNILNAMDMSLSVMGAALSAFSLGSAVLQQNYAFGGYRNVGDGDWAYGYVNRNTGFWRAFGRTAGGRYGVAFGNAYAVPEGSVI